MCAVSNVATFYNSLMLCFPDMILSYYPKVLGWLYLPLLIPVRLLFLNSVLLLLSLLFPLM